MKVTRLALVAFIAAACSAAQAADQKWTGSPQDWSSPSERECRLRVNSVSQPSANGPVALSASNLGDKATTFSFVVRVTRSGQATFEDRVVFGSRLPGSVSQRSTSKYLNGSLQGAEIVLSLRGCYPAQESNPVLTH
ncbi:MAG TPA: hypothetical protein PKD73_17000 [Burkholderiaceae bacterium]|nr:hypothetical protein [Burkholderiaceae bacterium]